MLIVAVDLTTTVPDIPLAGPMVAALTTMTGEAPEQAGEAVSALSVARPGEGVG